MLPTRMLTTLALEPDPHDLEVIRQKGEAVVVAVRAFVARKHDLEVATPPVFAGLGSIRRAFHDAKTRVVLLRDGSIMIRFADPRDTRPDFDVQIVNRTVREWYEAGPVVPAVEGEVRVGFKSSNLMSFVGCTLHDGATGTSVTLQYLLVEPLNAGDGKLLAPEETALTEYRLAALAVLLPTGTPTLPVPPEVAETGAIEALRALATEFEVLLGTAEREEELQRFLRANPVLLGPATDIIPKQRLADDWVTDFVLVNVDTTGPHYTLIEIEKATHRLFTKAGDPTAEFTHADGQTVEWELWLEQNQAFLRGKLPGFERPMYEVIMGRSGDLTEGNKGRLRVMNRRDARRKIRTYDDVLARIKEFIESIDRVAKERAAKMRT